LSSIESDLDVAQAASSARVKAAKRLIDFIAISLWSPRSVQGTGRRIWPVLAFGPTGNRGSTGNAVPGGEHGRGVTRVP
jgi:hypothetical protein